MNHFILNFADGDRTGACSFLRAKLWGIAREERHREALASGDLVLIYVAEPATEFIGRAELATAVHEWTPAEAQAYPGARLSGVVLADAEEWDHAVPLGVAVQRIDPTGSNPYVQANAKGFRAGVVLITADEFAAVVTLNREARES